MSSFESRFETLIKLSKSIARLAKPSLFKYFLTNFKSAYPALIKRFSMEKKPIFWRHFSSIMAQPHQPSLLCSSTVIPVLLNHHLCSNQPSLLFSSTVIPVLSNCHLCSHQPSYLFSSTILAVLINWCPYSHQLVSLFSSTVILILINHHCCSHQ